MLNLTLTSREKGGERHGNGRLSVPSARKATWARSSPPGCERPFANRSKTRNWRRDSFAARVTRVVTPGTVTDDALLDPRENNYLAAGRVRRSGRAGLGGIVHRAVHGGRIPRPAVGRPTCPARSDRMSAGRRRAAVGDGTGRAGDGSRAGPTGPFRAKPPRNRWPSISARRAWKGSAFRKTRPTAKRSAPPGPYWTILPRTQKSSLGHIDRLTPYRASNTLEIDQSSRRSLEISRTIRDGRRDGSLLWVLDRTRTPMGARLLGRLGRQPVDRCGGDSRPARRGRGIAGQPVALRGVGRIAPADVRHRAAGSLGRPRGRASPRDLSFLGRTLKSLPAIKEVLSRLMEISGHKKPPHCNEGAFGLLAELEGSIDLCPELRATLESSLADECPLTTREGGFIREGFSPELDALRELTRGGKQWIASYQAQEAKRTTISTLKVGFNNVFGYYIEITNSQREKVPPEYIRKQTLKNAERYITPRVEGVRGKGAHGRRPVEGVGIQTVPGLAGDSRDRPAAFAGYSRGAGRHRRAGRLGRSGSGEKLLPGRRVVEEPVLHITDGRAPRARHHRAGREVRCRMIRRWEAIPPLPAGEGPGVRAANSGQWIVASGPDKSTQIHRAESSGANL